MPGILAPIRSAFDNVAVSRNIQPQGASKSPSMYCMYFAEHHHVQFVSPSIGKETRLYLTATNQRVGVGPLIDMPAGHPER